MFEEQEVKIRVKDLNDMASVVIELKEMGDHFKSLAEDHEYDLITDHSNLSAMLHLYKIGDYDNTEQD